MKAHALPIPKGTTKPALHSLPARPEHLPRIPFTKTYCFFTHIAFAFDLRSHAAPQATASLLIEIDDRTLKSASRQKNVDLAILDEPHKAELAAEAAMAAAREYVAADSEFRPFPAQRFVNFELVHPTHISVKPPTTKMLPNGARVWRLAETEAEKLRGEPHSLRFPDLERRLAEHPFLEGMSPHHLEVLALCAAPTEFDPGQIVFRAGEPANGFYLLESGSVVLKGKTADGKSVVIDSVAAGEPLGWSWLFPPYVWEFDAEATEACDAICFSGILLRQHRDDDLTLSHELHKRMSELMVRRLRAAREKLISANSAA
jgi:CRP/FNR family transcriptional regulator, cyclic AMP receptor protein